MVQHRTSPPEGAMVSKVVVGGATPTQQQISIAGDFKMTAEDKRGII